MEKRSGAVWGGVSGSYLNTFQYYGGITVMRALFFQTAFCSWVFLCNAMVIPSPRELGAALVSTNYLKKCFFE